MTSFNLLSEQWVPCLFVDGHITRLLSLREVFRYASAIREINDDSPLVTAALYRLLLAILHRNLGPSNPAAWHALWNAPDLPLATLESYLDRWQDRFDLFHPQFPFFQSRSLSEEHAVPAAKLTHELATGNNATLFDHSVNGTGTAFTLDRAACYLIAHQAFAVGGLVSIEKGLDTKLFKSARGGPITKGAVALVKGPSLRQTLLLNFHQYHVASGQPFPVIGEDLPWWELGKEPEAGDSIPAGYLDLLTWQSRRIRLIPTATLSQRKVIEKVIIMKGRQTPKDWLLRGRETMIAFFANPNMKADETPWLPVGFRPERAIWRDAIALIHAAGDGRERPKNIDWLSRLVLEGYLDRKTMLSIDLYGLSTYRAKILLWRCERLPLPLRLLEDPVLVGILDQSLTKAEQVAGVLQRAAHRMAQLSLYRESDTRGKQKPHSLTVRNLAESWSPALAYWSALELEFDRHIESVANLLSETSSSDDPSHPLRQWLDLLSRVARRNFTLILRDVAHTARLAKAAAIAEAQFHRDLASVLPELSLPSPEHQMADPSTFAATFIGYLEDLSRRQERPLASLRHSFSVSSSCAPQTYRYVIPWLLDERSPAIEAASSLVAALFALHPDSGERWNAHGVNFGESLASLCKNRWGMEKRFVALLASPQENLFQHLRHAMALLKAESVSIDYLRLLEDLIHWNAENRFVQRAWAHSFWRQTVQPQPANEADSNPDPQTTKE
jgi:CRISPR system Cascade subunit CasA